MTNFEKYENEIKIISNKGRNFAFNAISRKISSCNSSLCEYCLFEPKLCENCGANKVNWLYEEYKEPVHIELTPFAKALLERAAERGFQYIARTKSTGEIIFFQSKPTIKNNAGNDYWDDGKLPFTVNHFFDDFPFIKKTDTEPWHIATLLKRNEV